jgi:hypothetical protein
MHESLYLTLKKKERKKEKKRKLNCVQKGYIFVGKHQCSVRNSKGISRILT